MLLHVQLVILAEDAEHLAFEGVLHDASEVRHLQLTLDRPKHLFNLVGGVVLRSVAPFRLSSPLSSSKPMVLVDKWLWYLVLLLFDALLLVEESMLSQMRSLLE